MQQLTNNTFSIRRLNPFNGLLQVYQQDSARALSANGVVWEIQVLSETPQGLWANTPLGKGQFFTFGLWSDTNGLEQVPINPLFDVRSMIAASDALISGLQPLLPLLPFPMGDHYELWLMDELNREPVALLHSCRTESETRLYNKMQKWIATTKGDFSFISPHLQQRGLPNHDGYNPRVHASVIEAEVRGRAGFQPQTEWFYNDPDAGMMYLIGDPATKLRFPELPLTESDYDTENTPLISDYIAWKAPQLLMLPNLSSETRDRLEQLAVKQAEQIDRLWMLYPEIHNKDLLKRARVEARIRKANCK